MGPILLSALLAIPLRAAVPAAPPSPVPAPSIIPKPSSMRVIDACTFHLQSGTTILAEPELDAVGDKLRSALSAPTGLRFPVKSAAKTAITLRLDPALADLGDEGYTLDVDAHRVSIRAYKPAGAFYAAQSLLQLFPPDIFRRAPAGRADWPAPCVAIVDKPRFPWRGLLLDVGRHFMPKDSIFRVLDLMAFHKLNTFQWHLTDDTGWRIEIKRYPRLQEISSRMDHSSRFPWDATRSPNVAPGGFYTQDDVREIVRYAAERGITIVPEIEMPGHAGGAIFAYPELGNRKQLETAGVDTAFLGGDDNVFNVEDSTLQFLKNVLDEVMALFPGPFVHIGGDEVWKEPWKRSPRVQQRMKELGLKTEEEMQSWFIKQLDAYLSSKGKRLIGWDEILEGGLAPGAAVTSWRGTEGGIAAARQGHDVVMNPTQSTYLDYYQGKPIELEPHAIADYYLPLEQAYKFDPVPKELTPEEAKHVLGGQAALWTEYVPDIQHAEYMLLPRLSAFAETVWSSPDGRDYNEFLARLKENTARLDAMGVRHRPVRPDPQPIARWQRGEVLDRPAVHEWDATPAIGDSADYKVFFKTLYDETSTNAAATAKEPGGAGAEPTRVDWIEIVEDGRTIAHVDKPFKPGGANDRDDLFLVRIQSRPGAKYTLRASLHSASRQSRGEIYFVAAY